MLRGMFSLVSTLGFIFARRGGAGASPPGLIIGRSFGRGISRVIEPVFDLPELALAFLDGGGRKAGGLGSQSDWPSDL
jgi:hypothetical protein